MAEACPLFLLEQLMEHVNDQRESQGLQKQEPWELFDLMGGTRVREGICGCPDLRG